MGCFRGFTMSAASLLVFGIVQLLSSGCTGEKARAVNLEKRETLKKESLSPEKEPIRIAVGSMITPRAGFTYYRELLDYIGEKLGRPVAFVGKEKYAEVNELLRTGGLDVAFVCSGPYVDGHDKFGMELLAVPQAYGETVYYSYILVHKDSPVRHLEGLRGKTFAFTDPDSNSGKLSTTYLLAKMNETPDSFFKHHSFTYAHDRSIKAVATGVVDGAAVDSLVWNYLDRTDPEYTSKTRIILKSEPFGIPPVVVRPGLDARTITSLRKIFLNVHNDEKGRKILKGMMIDKFVAADDAAYDSVRHMKTWIAEQTSKK